jgi:hypothetical protein
LNTSTASSFGEWHRQLKSLLDYGPKPATVGSHELVLEWPGIEGRKMTVFNTDKVPGYRKSAFGQFGSYYSPSNEINTDLPERDISDYNSSHSKDGEDHTDDRDEESIFISKLGYQGPSPLQQHQQSFPKVSSVLDIPPLPGSPKKLPSLPSSPKPQSPTKHSSTDDSLHKPGMLPPLQRPPSSGSLKQL